MRLLFCVHLPKSLGAGDLDHAADLAGDVREAICEELSRRSPWENWAVTSVLDAEITGSVPPQAVSIVNGAEAVEKMAKDALGGLELPVFVEEIEEEAPQEKPS